MAENGKLTVAVTGPTGSIGTSFIRELDREPSVGRVLGMARRPFDPGKLGLRKLEYVRGDIRDRSAVESLVAEADVVVHLAFILFEPSEKSRATNLVGARNVFEVTLESTAKRLIYTSSVAAYGWHENNPQPLTEDVPARGTETHYYSKQKAEVERLLTNLARHSDKEVYVFRPCIVAGPNAIDLIERIPLVKTGMRVPRTIRKVTAALPLLRPVLPDPGLEFQVVHEDDVADALRRATLGMGRPGIYNLSADGALTVADLARALGWYSIPLPSIAIDATAAIVSRLPLMPAEAKWVDSMKLPVIMDSSKAKKELGWSPTHDAAETLAQTIFAARAQGVLGSAS
ncbi:MAG TPA: NAD-dependent epimerase/dehydratase family protein [Actinomycetota bacterium]|nr:NAD-dependent epimerase/dehydratase family protein [Actinomycetota bacterium]